MKSEILYSNRLFDIVEIDNVTGIKMKTASVAILPYRNDDNGMVKEIGILKEYNPFRPDKYCETLITGTIEYEDDSLLYTASRELEEEGGFTVPKDEVSRWLFLGALYPYKDSDRMVPVFACDVSKIEQKRAKGDGSEQEKKSKLIMTDVSKGISSDESLVLASFLRLFNYMYSKTLGNV